MEHFCMGCMHPLEEGQTVCPRCGFDRATANPEGTLPIGTTLADHYTVGKVLGVFGDGIRYIAYDSIFKNAVELFEFFPGTLCEHAEDGKVKVLGGCERAFDDYVERYRKYIRTVGRTRDLPAVVPLYDILEENGTIFTVSEWVENETAVQWMKKQKLPLSWETVRDMTTPLLSALVSLHAAGAMYFGVSPENVLVDENGQMRLCHFGLPEARSAASDLTPHLVAGFSAPEQYSIYGECSAATDVYGCAALLYTLLTGDTLPAANTRKSADDLTIPAAVAQALPVYVRSALYDGLRPDAADRIATMQEFFCRVFNREMPQEAVEEAAEETPSKPHKKGLSLGAILGIAVAAFLIFIGGGLALIFATGNAGLIFGTDEPDTEESSLPTIDPLTEQPVTVYTEPPEELFAAEDVKGKNFFQIENKTFAGNMKVEIGYLLNDESAYGTILSQTPAAGDSVASGTTIKVVISAGPATKNIPDVVGWPRQYAEELLKQMDYQVKIVELTTATMPYGCVEKVSPEVGKERARGEEVTLYISCVEPVETVEPETEIDEDF